MEQTYDGKGEWVLGNEQAAIYRGFQSFFDKKLLL